KMNINIFLAFIGKIIIAMSVVIVLKYFDEDSYILEGAGIIKMIIDCCNSALRDGDLKRKIQV
ncbi:7534_t:CDS:1, partial [Gigaspora rosea]